MKNIWKIALLAAALMTSCTQPSIDEVTPEQGGVTGEEIQFYTVGDDSRTTYFEGEGLGIHWEEGDLVAVIARSFFDGAEKRSRMQYKATTSGASTTLVGVNETNTFTWETNLNSVPMNTIDVDFYAFHCGYSYSTSTTIYDGIKVVSSPDQTQSAAGDYSHIGNYTVLASNKVTRNVGNTSPIGFEFTNCMSVIELTIKGSEAKTISSVELKSENNPLIFSDAFLAVEDFSTSAEVVEEPYTIYPINGKGNTMATLSNTVTLTLTEPVTLSAEGAKLYLVVMPGVHAAGDITLTAIATDNTSAEVNMGAVTFEKNKVYRPTVTLNNFKATEGKQYAEIAISGADASKMFGTVNFENGALFINSRTIVNGHNANMATYNIPTEFHYTDENTWQTMSMMNGLHPNLLVDVKTSGYVYVLVDGNNANYHNALTNNGWTAETVRYSSAASDTQKAGFLEGAWDNTFPIFYATALDGLANIAYYTIYSKEFSAGDQFNLSDVVSGVSANFRGLRLVAKKIEWPVAQAEIQKTAALSDGELHTFAEGEEIATNSTAYITATRSELEKTLPAGFVGMKFFTMDRGGSAMGKDLARVVTAKVTKSGMLYQIVPKNAQALIKPSGKNEYDGWRVVDYFYLSAVTTNPFYISAQWVEAGDEITTYDYSSYFTTDENEDGKSDNASKFSYFNTGILMGDLTVKSVE